MAVVFMAESPRLTELSLEVDVDTLQCRREERERRDKTEKWGDMNLFYLVSFTDTVQA